MKNRSLIDSEVAFHEDYATAIRCIKVIYTKHRHTMGQDCPKCKETPSQLNVIDFDIFGFNLSIWVPWSLLGPKKSQ